MIDKSHSWKYSDEYVIPAPVIEIHLFNPQKNLQTSARFLLDTGSDMTCIRWQIFDNLELIIDGEETFGLVGNIETTKPISQVTLEIPSLNISESLEVAIDTNDVDNLLGRDFINKFGTYLDGRKLEFTIEVQESHQ